MQHDWLSLEKHLETSNPSEPGVNSASSGGSRQQEVGRECGRKGWGEVLREEYVMLCRRAQCGDGAPPHEDKHLPHRLYVQKGAGELRAATALVHW
jgi:hypothetical protein